MTGTGPDDDFETIATTVGRARPGLEVRIADDDGQRVPVGEAGEVLVRGYSVMRGYLDDPGGDRARPSTPTVGCTPVTSARSTSAGACASSGARRTCSSSAASTRTRPRSRTCSSVTPRWARVAVVGMPDERLGEVGMAFVVAAPGAVVDPEELIGWACDTMANYKVPRGSSSSTSFRSTPAARSRRTRCAPVPRGREKEGIARGHPLLAGAARAATQRGLARRRPRSAHGRRPRRRRPAREARRRRAAVGVVRAARAGRGRRSVGVGRRGRDRRRASSDGAPPTRRSSGPSSPPTWRARPASSSRTRAPASCSTARCSTSASCRRRVRRTASRPTAPVRNAASCWWSTAVKPTWPRSRSASRRRRPTSPACSRRSR